MLALATASQNERSVGEPSHFTDRTRASFAGRAYPAYLGRITQIFGDRKFACDKIAGCKGCKTCNLINIFRRAHKWQFPSSYICSLHPGPLIASLIELNCSSAHWQSAVCTCPDFNVAQPRLSAIVNPMLSSVQAMHQKKEPLWVQP